MTRDHRLGGLEQQRFSPTFWRLDVQNHGVSRPGAEGSREDPSCLFQILGLLVVPLPRGSQRHHSDLRLCLHGVVSSSVCVSSLLTGHWLLGSKCGHLLRSGEEQLLTPAPFQAPSGPWGLAATILDSQITENFPQCGKF